jgi:hypothetical protein
MNNYTKLSFLKILQPGISSMVLLCAIAMAYGWGWRGNYGHEYGAMFAGALLAMGAALASGRQDWYRRILIMGLFGAVGWAFGGSMSYMEHNWYINSNSLVDTAYGYFGFGFIAFLWTGVGAAILALAFTKKISELEKYARVAMVIGIIWFIEYLYLTLFPAQKQALVLFVENNFHDGEFSAALSSLIISSVYWLVRPNDRKEAALYIKVIVGYWIGYLALTKFGGLYLAPPNRSESWGGNVGMLVVLMLHHYKQKNRAAIMFINYAMLTGTLAYILAVFLHNPIRIGWNGIQQILGWKIAEEGFGLFMGLGVALGFAKLIKGGLAIVPEDSGNKKKLDIFSLYMLVIVIMWLNIHKNVIDWGNRYDILPKIPLHGLYAWQWFLVVGIFCTLFVIYCIRLYQKGRLALVPKSAFEKGLLVFIVMIIISIIGVTGHRQADWADRSTALADTSYYILAFMTIWIVVVIAGRLKGADTPPEPKILPEDKKWSLDWKFYIWWSAVPVLIAIVTWLTLAMSDGTYEKSRKRFGPDAYWRQVQEQVD